MEKILKNRFGDVITEQQAELLKKYRVDYVNNGETKKIHHVDKDSTNQLHIDYYLDSTENIPDVEHALGNETNSFAIIETTLSSGNVIREYKCYSDGEYSGLEKKLFTGELEICQQSYFISGAPILNSTEKFYYDSEGNEKLRFTYDDDGNISSVTGEPPFEPYDNQVTSLFYDKFVFYNPTFLSENPYYADATFLP